MFNISCWLWYTLISTGCHQSQGTAEMRYKGKPLLAHIINKVPKDISILVNTNKKFEVDFQKWRETINRDVEICVESALSNDQKLGAISSLNFRIDHKAIAEDLLVIASDSYFEFDLSQFIVACDGKNTLVAVYDIGDKSKSNSVWSCQVGWAPDS